MGLGSSLQCCRKNHKVRRPGELQWRQVRVRKDLLGERFSEQLTVTDEAQIVHCRARDWARSPGRWGFAVAPWAGITVEGHGSRGGARLRPGFPRGWPRWAISGWFGGNRVARHRVCRGFSLAKHCSRGHSSAE